MLKCKNPTPKEYRILIMYEKLFREVTLNSKKLADEFNVTSKTIKRDISSLKNFLIDHCDFYGKTEIIYSKKDNGYKLITDENLGLTCKQVLFVSKFLLQGRFLCREELDSLLKGLNDIVPKSQTPKTKELIANDHLYYTSVSTAKPLIDVFWDLSVSIKDNKKIEIFYTDSNNKKHKEKILPIKLLLSEYYVYLVSYLEDSDFNLPILYRIDKISNFKFLDERFCIPNNINTFKKSEFRKANQFMYTGELMKLRFKYFGNSLDTIFDRFPNAEKITQDDNEVVIETVVFRNSIKKWLLCQMDNVEVIYPKDFRDEFIDTINKIHKIYK